MSRVRRVTDQTALRRACLSDFPISGAPHSFAFAVTPKTRPGAPADEPVPFRSLVRLPVARAVLYTSVCVEREAALITTVKTTSWWAEAVSSGGLRKARGADREAGFLRRKQVWQMGFGAPQWTIHSSVSGRMASLPELHAADWVWALCQYYNHVTGCKLHVSH